MNKQATVLSVVVISMFMVVVGSLALMPSATAQTDATPLPEVETAVAGTLTALAPSPTWTVDEQVALTVTATLREQGALKIWVTTEQGVEHEWQRELTEDLQAESRAEATLIAVIRRNQTLVGSRDYFGCSSSVDGFRIDYSTQLIDPQTDIILDQEIFEGASPTFPNTISSCSSRRGQNPRFSLDFQNWIIATAYVSQLAGPPMDPDFVPHLRYSTGTIIRECPNERCAVVGRLPEGESFLVTGRSVDNRGIAYFSLDWDGGIAWILHQYTGEEPPE